MNESTIKIALISSLLIFLSFYFFLNRRIKNAKLIHSAWDDHVPFIAFSVIPYLLFYSCILYGSIFLSFFQELRLFYAFCFGLIFVLAQSYSIFIVYPTRVNEFNIRSQSFWNSIVRMVYQYDMRVTAFPSIHVGVTLLCGYHVILWYPEVLYVVLAASVSIIISTVTIKQHSIIDIVGGFITGITSIIVGNLLI